MDSIDYKEICGVQVDTRISDGYQKNLRKIWEAWLNGTHDEMIREMVFPADYYSIHKAGSMERFFDDLKRSTKVINLSLPHCSISPFELRLVGGSTAFPPRPFFPYALQAQQRAGNQEIIETVRESRKEYLREMKDKKMRVFTHHVQNFREVTGLDYGEDYRWMIRVQNQEMEENGFVTPPLIVGVDYDLEPIPDFEKYQPSLRLKKTMIMMPMSISGLDIDIVPERWGELVEVFDFEQGCYRVEQMDRELSEYL